jgi:anti-sigma factor RsiW
MNGTCRLEKYLTAYVDGELSGRLKKKVESHIERCPACARELDAIRSSDRILRAYAPPPVSEGRWKQFRLELGRELDKVDRLGRRPVRIPEARPLCGTGQRRAFALAAVGAAIVLAVLAVGPVGWLPWRATQAIAGNECVVDSIESLAAGYTPMYFSSEDPEMTVIWVFADNVDRGGGPGAR